MQKLAHAAYAAALVSVMAISAGPANAQMSADKFHELACIDSGGLCYTDGRAIDPGYVNLYRPYAGNRYVNMYQPDQASEPLARGLFGIALEETLANWDQGANTYSNRYIDDQAIVIDDNVAACEARYQSYDAGTGMYLGYDGNYHPCRL